MRRPMKTAENINKVALIFFVTLGFAHILSGLMLNSSYLLPWSLITNRVLDIPFVIIGLIYGYSCIYEDIAQKNQKIATTVFTVITIIIFIALVLINVLLKDVRTT